MRRFAPALAVGLLVALGCKGGGDRPAATTPASEPSPVAAGATPAPVAIRAEQQVVAAPPFLWKATKAGRSIHLFGTMHMGVNLRADVNAVVLATLATAKTFVMEADISEVDGAELLNMAKLSGDSRLDRMLSRERWSQLTERLTVMPEAELSQLEPWFVIVNLSQTILPTLAPMDSVLRATAEGNGAKVEFLETWQYQIELIGEVMSVDDLSRMLEDFDGARQDLIDLAAAYKRGDANAVAGIIFDPEDYTTNPKVVDLLLVRRNKEWMPYLDKFAADNDAFVAVGLGHLLGDRGVLAMLREQGYQIERVAPTS